MKTNLYTRRELIEIWSKQSDEHLDSYVCPRCRDILYKMNEGYFCDNLECSAHRDGIKLVKE